MADRVKNFIICRHYYRLGFLLITLGYSLTPVTFVSSALNTVLLIWGAVLILYDLLTRRVMFQSKRCVFLIAFMGLYAVTLVLNREMNLFDNLKVFMVTGLQFFALLPVDKDTEQEKLEQQMVDFNRIIIVFTFIFSSIALLMYFFWINGSMGDLKYGSDNGMLVGLYVGANTGAPLAAISLVAALINCHLTERRLSKFLVLNVIVQLCYIYLSNSRAAIYALIVFGLIYALFYLRGGKNKAIGLGGTFLFYIMHSPVKHVLYWIQQGIQWVLDVIKSIYNRIFRQWDTIPFDPDIPSVSPVPEPDKEITMGFLNGRASLWRCCLEIIKDYPLFGIGSRNITEMALRYDTLENLPGIYGGFHNILLTILVSNGILGFVCLTAFAAACIWIVVQFFMKHHLSGKNSFTILLCLALLLMLLTNNMVEANILYSASYMATVFWSYLGFMLFFCDKSKEQPTGA